MQLRELYSRLCRDPNGKEILNRGDMWACVTDPLCCTPETNSLVKQLYSNKNQFKNLMDRQQHPTVSHRKL